MPRPFFSVLSILSILVVPSVPGLRAQDAFLEKYALAADRAAVLKELIPGTDDYYFYNALHSQTHGQQDQAAALLNEWEERSSGPNGRRDLLKNRAALLAWSNDPSGTLAWLKAKLALTFDHQRRTEEARAGLPSVLDPAAIAFSVFERKPIENTESLENVTDSGLYRLPVPVEKWKLSEVRALLKRLTRPDFPGLVDVIHRELDGKGAKFGDFPIHTLLTSDQLAELQKLRPALLNNETFTAAVLTRMRPLDTEDAGRDPAVRRAWLERLWAYASTLNPNANPLKANLLYHLLAHDEKQGRLDEKRLFAYLKLPRPVAYINPRYKEDRDIWKFPARLDFDPSSFTGTAPIGDDEPLIRRLVIRYLTNAENSDALAPLVSDAWLRGVLAEAKLLSGAPQPQRWVSLLPPEAYQALRDRTDIEFDPASPQSWPREEAVTLNVWLKNVPSLLVRIYEINTANVHRTTGEQVSTALDLDGLTANFERKFDYLDAPILRTKQTFAFPELEAKRGVWIIEFVGNGRASRALIQKGELRPIVRQTSAGSAVTVLDEKLQPLPGAFAMVGPKRFDADDKGLILLPLSEKPGAQKVIFDDGNGFTALETIELQGESYALAAGFHVPRESLLPGNKATLLVRPRLTSNGRPVLLESLEKVKITLASTTLDGTPATAVFPIEKLAEDKETTVEFAVPDRLKSLTFTLNGEVKSALTGSPVQVSASQSLEVNTLTTSGQVSDLHLSQNAGQWIIQELGLTGEPRHGREVNLTFVRPEFTTPVQVPMKTDATGSIALGTLEGVSAVTATHADGITRSFPLPRAENTIPRVIHAKSGEPVMFPWADDRAPLAGEVSFISLTGPTSPGSQTSPIRLIPVPPPANGYLIWKALPPGTYSLFLRGRDHSIRISPGDAVEGHVLTPASTLQLTANRPLTVTGFKEGDAKLPDGKSDAVLVFHIGNVSAETRVHIFASRFLPEFDAMSSLGGVQTSTPSSVRPAWNPSVYLSSRNIGDEYRYVLERRSAARFAGNLLVKPGLLLNPWEIAVTKMEKDSLQDLEKAGTSELLPKPAELMKQMHGHEHKKDQPADPSSAANGKGPPPAPDLSFLATPGPVALNLKPDANGNVIVSRASLGDRQYVRVLAIDGESSATRDFSFAAAALPPRDLRLARQLDPAQHFSRQNRVTVLEADAPFRFDDALAAQFQAIGHLGAVQQLFFNLTQNPLLNEFSWLLDWKTFDDAKKRALYSQYACHELHFFLSRKDTKFFDAVVKPHLASKRELTFMDDYLLGSDLTRYLAPWPYGRLNALERILLAERIKEEQPTARRMAADWINTQPANRGRDMFLFETVLRGTALIADRSEAEGKVAANRRYDWYFDSKNSGDLLRRLEGSNFFLTTRSNAPEMTVFGTPRVVQFPLEGFATFQVPDDGVSEMGRRVENEFGIVEAKLPQTWEDYSDLYTDLNRPAKEAELKQRYNKALGYHDLGQFNEAEVEFDRMLALDPNNTAARRGLERVQRGTADYLKTGRDVTRLKMLSDVDTLWGTQLGVVGAGGTVERKFLGGAQNLRGWAYREVVPTYRGVNVAGLVRNSDGKFEIVNDSVDGMTNISDNAIPNLAVIEAEQQKLIDLANSDPAVALELEKALSKRVPIPPNATQGPISYSSAELHYRNTDGDFDNGVGLVPDASYLTRFKARDLSERGRLFRQQDPTKVWAEQQYYKLPLEAQTAGLVPMNRFWRDYALWDGKGGFLSTNVADAAGTFSEMVLALAVLDLPFPGDYKAGKVDTRDNVLTLTPASRLLLFHQDILPAEPDKDGTPLLVSQNFYREGDRYIEQAGEKTDKFVSAEFLTGAVYGCQVVVTNPSSSRQRLDVLFQIPAGALPVKTTRRVQSLPVQIDAFRTATLDFHFYFPQPGRFAHFPVHISRDTKTAASAAPFVFNVVGKPTINDPASWDYVSQHGTSNEVLSFLDQHNLYFLDLDKMLWRLKDADFFRRAIAHLKSRHHFDEGVWSYAVLHNSAPFLTEYLMVTNLTLHCGPAFESELLTVNPVEQQTYQHLEYSPLGNARAHPLGGDHRILNDKFRAQWESLLGVLAFRTTPTAEDMLAVAGYLATQDRIEEALEFFARVDRAAVAEKLQYEYLRAWLAMCQEDTATARRIASALLAHPVKHWRDKFAILTGQLDEREGKQPDSSDLTDPSDPTDHNALADREPALALTSESNMVTVHFHNVEEVIVSYYPVDLEFLFSANPFVTQNAGRFASIRPAHSDKIMLPAGAEKHTWALPAKFHSDNVLVEVTGAGLSKAIAVYANALDVQVSESFGQLTVQHDKKPLAKSYVKVFADVNGAPAFYKDGYTDLRGKFDYASLSTDDLNGARRFSILIMSEAHGAVVKEVKPPAR